MKNSKLRQNNLAKAFHCVKKANCQTKNDTEIIQYVKSNKECYFCLMERYEEKIIRYVRRISGVPTETAEDITQNIFLKVYLNLNDFNEEQKFSCWLYKIARNETINYWRLSKKRNADISWEANEPLKSTLRDNRDVEDEVFQKITNQQLSLAINGLDDKYRRVVIMNYLEDKSYQEISKALKKPIGTVGTLLNRAKKALKEKLFHMGLTPDSAMR